MAVQILKGDCRSVLATLPAESVHCVVTSPPYWGLRDYGTARWDGGNPLCDHQKPMAGIGHIANSTLGGGKATNAAQISGYRNVCGKCDARRIDNQIGLELVPEAFVSEILRVFRELRRVLRSDGTAWLNLGDSYAGPDKSQYAPGLAAKQLVGIPWRVAFALQADGWYLRQDIIWSKPNPMPESVRDRCTKAHEYMFLLSKNERYHYDQDAIAEQSVIGSGAARNITPRDKGAASTRNDGDRFGVVNDGTRNKRSVWEVTTSPYAEAHFATFPPALIEPCILAGCPKGGTVLDPFGGAGTTGLVADRLCRNAILIELNPDYAEMAERRIRGDAGMFAEVVA